MSQKKYAWMLFLCCLLPSSICRANLLMDVFQKLKNKTSSGATIPWKFVASLPLYNEKFPTFHPQGLKIIGRHAYLSTVEGRSTGFGHLIKYVMNSSILPRWIRPEKRITFDPGRNGKLNHAGGIDADKNFIYLPLSEYNSVGPSQILQVSLQQFGKYNVVGSIKDHIGTVIYDKTQKLFHLLDWFTGIYSVFANDFKNGSFFPKSILEEDWEYQDCKDIGEGYAICSAKKGNLIVFGEIHLIQYDENRQNMNIVHRLRVPHIRGDGTPGGRRPLSYNAMDFSLLRDTNNSTPVGMRFYFVPHDDEDSHLFIFDVPISTEYVFL